MSESSCRLCLGEVHPDDRGSSMLEDLFRRAINRVFSFEIKHDDRLPIYTCNDCSQQVWDFNSYSQLVERNQNTLQETHLPSNTPSNSTESAVLYPIDPDKIKKETITTNEEFKTARTVPIPEVPEDCGLLPAIKKEPTDCDEQVESVPAQDAVKCELNHSDTEVNAQEDQDVDHVTVSDTAIKAETIDLNETDSDSNVGSNDDEANSAEREESITSTDCKNLIEKMRERIRERIAANKVGCFRCEICDRSYPNERYLKTHNAVVHAPYVRRKLWFPCNLCNRSFSIQSLLHAHRKTHPEATQQNADAKKDKPSEEESADGSDSISDANVFRCNECFKTFTCHKSLRTHTDVMHPFMVRERQTYSCDQCDRTFDECRKLTKHRRKHKFQQCPVCKKQLLKQNIGTHILAHQGEFRCDVCGKSLSCKKSLKRHLETIHSSASDRANHKFTCSLCPRKFYHIAHLQNHRQFHIMQKCVLCDKLVRKTNLYEHIAAHKGAYRCKPCNKMYTTKLGLKIHEKQKHGIGA